MITMKPARSTLLPALIFVTSILLLFSCSESTEDTTKVIAESPLTGIIQGQITPDGSSAMVELIKDNQVKGKGTIPVLSGSDHSRKVVVKMGENSK